MKKVMNRILVVILLAGATTLTQCKKDKDEAKPTDQEAKDKTSPTITLEGDNPMTIMLNQTFNDPGYTAKDDIDGDISQKVTKSGSVDPTKTGTYTITYKVTDDGGNTAQVTRTVYVRHSAQSLAGTYSATDDCAESYQGQVLAATEDNDDNTKITLVNLKGNLSVPAKITGETGQSITIPEYTNEDLGISKLSGSGKIDETGKKITLTYSYIGTNNEPKSCAATWTKQ